MSLIPGTSVGSYEVTGTLGAGGMGEVYRGRDTRLNRDVAIKILPDVVAHDTDRVARFTREAQTLAALNHPNIAQIYGIIEAPAAADAAVGMAHVHALVMELVEGEDLSTIIARHAGSKRPGLHGLEPRGFSPGDTARRRAADREADRGRPRGRARAGHRPPRPQAREHQGPRRRHREGARLRTRQSAARRTARRARRRTPTNSAHVDGPRHPDGDDPRHGGLHGARAGARQGRRQARRHLGLRRRALRDAHRPPRVRGRRHLGHPRRRAAPGGRLDRAARGHAAAPSAGCCAAASRRTRAGG